LANEIRALALTDTNGAGIQRVGILLDTILDLFRDETLMPDSVFRTETYEYQANWDEWGRGYNGGKHSATTGPTDAPDILILPVQSRTDCINALTAVSSQGEANDNASDTFPSHFARFLRVYKELKATDGAFAPSRNVPVNPVVLSNFTTDDEGNDGCTIITNPVTQRAAHLFNLRYELLLTCLQHAFEYPGSLSDIGQLTPRGLLINSMFGEMYNLRALSSILMESPLSTAASEAMAGPPFQVPFTMNLPVDDVDRWNLHIDVLSASTTLATELLADGVSYSAYLRNLIQADAHTREIIGAIINREAVPLSAARIPRNAYHHSARGPVRT
jgi:hypothetical protein